MTDSVKSNFMDCLVRLSKGEILPMPLSRNLSSVRKGLHEIRLRDSAGIYRFFYFVKVGDAIYFVHAFKKKTREIPKKELAIVLARLKEL